MKGEERKGEGKDDGKYENIFSHHDRDNNGFKEWIEGSNPQICQTQSELNVYDDVKLLWLVLREYV